MTHYSTFLEFTAPLLAFIRSSERGIEPKPPHVGGDQFNELALELFALQFVHNAPYRRFCEAREVSPETITDWANIPAIPTSAFKELELTSLSLQERMVVFHSSGTTEQRPSRHFHSAESLAIYEASLLSWFAAQVLTDSTLGQDTCSAVLKKDCQREPGKPLTRPSATLSPSDGERDGVRGHRKTISENQPKDGSPSPARPSPPGDGESSSAPDKFMSRFRILSLTPSPTEATHSSLVHMFETIRCKFGSADSAFVGHVASDGAWVLDLEQTFAALREFLDQPIVLLGTAFAFVHLLDFLVGKNLRFNLPPGSRVLETGGYKGRSREMSKTELQALITKRLGIPPSHIVCEYSMSELSSQAYDRIAGGGTNPQLSTLNSLHSFRFPPWARAQIISPETGHEVAEGETGLIRVFDLANVWSVMAIQTEDLGVRHGAGFELIGRAKTAEPRGCSLMTP